MALSKLFSIYSIQKLGVGPPTAFDLTDIVDSNWDAGADIAVDGASGSADALMSWVKQHQGKFSITTRDLGTVIDKITMNGVFQSAPGDDLVMFLAQRNANGPGLDPGSVHVKMVIETFFIFPRSFQWSEGEAATCTLDIVPLWDGSANDPVTITNANALAGAPAVVDQWTGGPAVIDGTTIFGLQNLTWDLGLNESYEYADGEVQPRMMTVLERLPKVTFATRHADLWLAHGAQGGEAIATELAAYFTKVIAGGGRDLGTNLTHVKLEAFAGQKLVTQTGGSHGELVNLNFEINVINDTTNPTQSATNGVALPT